VGIGPSVRGERRRAGHPRLQRGRAHGRQVPERTNIPFASPNGTAGSMDPYLPPSSMEAVSEALEGVRRAELGRGLLQGTTTPPRWARAARARDSPPARSCSRPALALLANAVAATAARWWAGRYGGRLGQARLLVGGVVGAAIGMLALVLTTSQAAVAAGAVLLGLGFGVAQNASLTLMFERVSASGYDMVSAMYNLAYDAGLGLGAAGFGLLVTRTGYGGAFGLVAVLMLVALAPVWRDRRWLAPALGSEARRAGGR